jgi:hypothetical protein
MIKSILFSFILFLTINTNAQVFNFGHQDLAFKNFLENGICFMKTGNAEFDSTMLEALDKYWTITDFTYVEQYKHPPKEMTAMFVTTKTKTKKHVMDRKNQHVLVLQPAKLWKKGKQVPFDQTLGYMYYNGFYELLKEEDEPMFNRYVVQCLNKGLTIIKEEEINNNNQDMNEQIAASIVERSKGLLGNTLILNRENLVHFLDIKKVEKYGMTHRLFAKEDFLKQFNTTNRTWYMLYYSVNTRTELSLININTGELIYTRHFPEGYQMIKPKDLKLFAPYF